MALNRKTGGRKKGTPNKTNPFRAPLTDICMSYLEKKDQEIEMPDGSTQTVYASQMELDLTSITDPKDRVALMAKVFRFVIPELKSVDMDMTVSDDSIDIEDRLRALCSEDDVPHEGD